MTSECKHGQLKRQCLICELEEEVADLKHDIATRDKLIGGFAVLVDIIKGLSVFEQHNDAQKHLTALVKHARELVK